MKNRSGASAGTACVLLLACAASATAQRDTDAVLRAIQEEGTARSRVEPLAQVLNDSLGPRLTGSPGMDAARDWLIRTYRGWGIDAREEQYGTWRTWRRGTSRLDLLAPRVRSLEARMLAWSPGTRGPVTAPAVVLPDISTPAEFAAWLPAVRGRFVLLPPPQLTCRADDNWARFATPESLRRLNAEREAQRQTWLARLSATGVPPRELPGRLEDAGAAGILTTNWSGGWGTDRVFDAATRTVPTFGVSCEDYGLVYRLAARGQGPVLRMEAKAEDLGEKPVFNTIARIPGRELPNEYVVLSAHFDTWDGASGSTDNGTGTIAVMEAMRILRAVYPRPRRTILAGHWSGEEQGLNGSRAFVADNPEIVRNLQILFNQDNGTGRIASISMQGFTGIAPLVKRWLARVPGALGSGIDVDEPGVPSQGGSDYASFVCAGAPALGLSSLSWDYGTYTWHTNRDTFDKIVFDDLRGNATLIAMLAYLAAEEPARAPRARRTSFPVNPNTGHPYTWPACREAARTSAARAR